MKKMILILSTLFMSTNVFSEGCSVKVLKDALNSITKETYVGPAEKRGFDIGYKVLNLADFAGIKDIIIHRGVMGDQPYSYATGRIGGIIKIFIVSKKGMLHDCWMFKQDLLKTKEGEALLDKLAELLSKSLIERHMKK